MKFLISVLPSWSFAEDNITMMVESEVVDSIMNSLAYHMKVSVHCVVLSSSEHCMPI